MNPLQSRLAALRRRLRLVVTLRGVSLTAAILLTGVLVGGLFDHLVYQVLKVETLSLIRAAFLVATLTGSSVVAYLLLFRPLSARTDDLSLALRVEEQYPILNDSLASTVQFLEQTAPESQSGTSPSLRKEAVQRALRLAQGCDFAKAVNPRGLSLSVLALLAVVIAALPLVFFGQARAWTAVQRFADPFGDHPWRSAGTDTELIVQAGKHYPEFLAIGQSLTITGEVRKLIPAKATIQFDDSDLQTREVDIKVNDGVGTFVATGIKPGSHRREIRFRVKANDAVSPPQTGAWHVVALRQAPQLAALGGKPSPQITLLQPRYTGLPEVETVPEGTGNLDVIAGTSVILRAATDQPIARVWVEFKPLLAGAREALVLAPLGTQIGGIEPTITQGLASSTWGKVPGQIDADGKVFTVRFLPGLTGAYVLTIEDHNGLAKSYEFDLNVRQDPVPVVHLEQPSVSQSILANADVTLQIRAEDEIFGLRSCYLEYRRKDRHGQWIDLGPKRLLLYDNDKAGAGLPWLLNGLAASPILYPAAPVTLHPKRLQIVQRWSLKGLAIEGETLVIQACADDYNDVPAFPYPGRSHEIELKIVGKQGLAQVIDEREAQIQDQLVKLRDMQERAIKKLIGVEEQLKATGKLRSEDLVELAEVEQLQKDIQARIGAKKDEGLRAELGQFEQMLKDNKMGNSEVARRAQDIREELERIDREHLPKLDSDLENARRQLETPATKEKEQEVQQKAAGDLDSAHKEQDKVHAALGDLLKMMEEHSTLQQIKAELRALLQEQKDRLLETEKLLDIVQQKNNDYNVLRQSQLKADLRRTATLQGRLPKRGEKLLDDMEALANKLEQKNDKGLQELVQRALDIAKPKVQSDKGKRISADLPDIMRAAAESLKDEFEGVPLPKKGGKPRDPRPPNVKGAKVDMREAVDTLEKMLAALDQSRADELDRLIVQQKKAARDVDDLEKRMQAIQRKIDAAQKIPDAKEREATLKKLGDELRNLQKDAEQRAGELARAHARDAANDLKNVAKKLERAVRELERGGDPKEDLEAARQDIDNAAKNLKDANQLAEEELAREKIAKIVDRLKGLKERQDGAIVESGRLLKSVLQSKNWERTAFISFTNLRDNQDNLAKDTMLTADKLKGAKVYYEILQRAVKDMKDAETSIETRIDKAPPRFAPHTCDDLELKDEKTGAERTMQLQQAASDRLQRLIEALLPELEPPPKVDQPPNKDGGKDGGKDQQPQKGGIQAQDGIPGVAQLKALKAEQLDVNARTKEFAQRHPDFNKLTRQEQAELDAIRAEQERLLDLFREMVTAAKAEGGKQ
jgi:hypothetical protein